MCLFVRRVRCCASAVTIVLALALASTAANASPKPFSIDSEEAPRALLEFGRQSALQILFATEKVKGIVTNAVHGNYEPIDALRLLLKGTPLVISEKADGVLVVQPQAKARNPVNADPVSINNDGSSTRFMQPGSDPASNTSTPNRDSSSVSSGSDNSGLNEITVTATKRSERLQDVPISMAVVGADEISERDLVGAADYLRAIPGVNQVESGGSGGYGGQAIIIRGIATDTQAQNVSAGATTATYFGEIPTTTSAGFFGSSADLKLVDIERVEVLRGPQGTSFGDSSLGGAVRTIPVAPNLDVFEGKLAAGQSETAGFGGSNDDFQAVLNVPLIEGTLAIRAVAYKFTDSGYYRNFAGSNAAFQQSAVIPYGVSPEFAHDESQVGSSDTWGGRIAALYHVSNDLKFTVTYITQRTTQDGFGISTTQTPYGQALFQVAPEQVVGGRDAGGAYYVTNLANAVGEYNLGWATLVGTYSYITGENHYVVPEELYGVNQPISIESGPSSSPTHRQNVGELRAVSRLAGPWNFVAGLYVDHQVDFADRTYYWYGDPATNPYAPGKTSLGFYDNLEQLTQKAAFGEVTWELLPGLTLLGGAR
jgi:iron complex outermembrane recepter protein